MIYLTKTILFCFLTFSVGVFAEKGDSPKENKTKTPYPLVKMETSVGELTIELYPEEAPITVANFLKYIDDGFYTGTIFHRVVPNFVIQGGGFTYDFKKKPTRAQIVNEANNGLLNLVGTLSMARTSNPNSATSQFFINLVHNKSLDYAKQANDGYAVFGKVIEGMDTVRKVELEPRGLHRAHPAAPNYPVIIEKAYRLNTQ